MVQIVLTRSSATKGCSASGKEALEYKRLFEQRTADCEIKIFPPRNLSSIVAKGEAEAGFGYVVGSAALDAKYAFEISESEQMSAVMTNPGKCLDLDGLKAMPLPSRTCVANYIVGSVLTQIQYRRFREATGESSNGISQVRIDGKLHVQDEVQQAKYFLSVDTVPIGHYFARNDDGFLTNLVADAALPETSEIVEAVALESALLKQEHGVGALLGKSEAAALGLPTDAAFDLQVLKDKASLVDTVHSFGEVAGEGLAD